MKTYRLTMIRDGLLEVYAKVEGETCSSYFYRGRVWMRALRAEVRRLRSMGFVRAW